MSDGRVKVKLTLEDGRIFYAYVRKQHHDKIDALAPLIEPPSLWVRIKAVFRKPVIYSGVA